MNNFNTFLHNSSTNKLLINALATGYAVLSESLNYSGTDAAEVLLSKYNVNADDLDELGSGEFGTAFSMGNGLVMKITSSKSEADIAQIIKDGRYSNLVTIHDIIKDVDDGTYIIIQEELETDSEIETNWYMVEELLETQGLGMSELKYFDDDEYIEEYGEIDESLMTAYDEFRYIMMDYEEVARNPDFKPDNIGRSKDGILKAFDVDNKG